VGSAAPYVGRVGRLVRPRLGVWGQWLVTFDDTESQQPRKRRQPPGRQAGSSSSSSSSSSTSVSEHDSSNGYDDYSTSASSLCKDDEDDDGFEEHDYAGAGGGRGREEEVEHGGLMSEGHGEHGEADAPGGGALAGRAAAAALPAEQPGPDDMTWFVAPVLTGRAGQGAGREGQGGGAAQAPSSIAAAAPQDVAMLASGARERGGNQVTAVVRGGAFADPAAQREWGFKRQAAKDKAGRRAERERLFWQREARRRMRRRAKRALRCEHKRSRHKCRDCSDWFNTGYVGVCNLEYADGLGAEELRGVLAAARRRRDQALRARAPLPKKTRKKDNQTGRKLWPCVPGLRVSSIGERGVDWEAGQTYNVSYRAQGHCRLLDGGYLGFYLYRDDELTATLGGRLYARPHAPDDFDFVIAANATLGRHWLYVVGLDSRGVPHTTDGRWTLACQSLGPVNILPPAPRPDAIISLPPAGAHPAAPPPLPPHLLHAGSDAAASGGAAHAHAQDAGHGASAALGAADASGAPLRAVAMGARQGEVGGGGAERVGGVECWHEGGAVPEREAREQERAAAAAGGSQPGLVTKRQGQIDEVERRLEAAVRLAPTSVTALCNYGTLLHEVHHDDARAQECYRRALALDPAHVTTLFNLAGLLRDSGASYDEAEALYRRLLLLAPTDVGALCNYASLLYQVRGMADLAERMYRQALLLDPSDAAVLSNYAQLLLSHRQDAEGADFMYAKALETRPADPATLANYASFIHTVLHDYKRAEDMYKRALAVEPGCTQAICNYANLLTAVRKDFESALQLLSNAPYGPSVLRVRRAPLAALRASWVGGSG
jgi:Tfp pilus assembly protein PilF